MGILAILISWIKEEYDCHNGKVQGHVTQLQNWRDWTTKAEVEWSQIAKKVKKKDTLFLLGLVSGFNDLVFKLSEEKLGIFGSNVLKL